MSELKHHGIKGMKWGVRRFQNKDGTRTPAGRKRAQKADMKWSRKNSAKITKKASKKTSREMDKYAKQLMSEPGSVTKAGKLSAKTINSYNKKMAQLMSEQVSDLKSPSGKTVTYVAKRGEIGVFMALADQGYNMNQLKNGIYDSGKVAYKKQVVNKMDTNAKVTPKSSNKRIADEISKYDKKNPGFAKKFYERYDDHEMWDLYSPEELMR